MVSMAAERRAPSSYPNQVRALRKARGIGRAELAAKIGVTPSALTHLENGHRLITRERAEQLAAALECEMIDLFLSKYGNLPAYGK